MAAIGYIPHTEEIVNASLSNFQLDGATAFKLSERLHLAPALSAQDRPGGWTQVLNDPHIKRIDSHPAECDEGSTH